MNNKERRLKVQVPNTISAIALGLFLIIMPIANPCEFEDSRICTWNSQQQGNGTGLSFTDFYGLTVYHP